MGHFRPPMHRRLNYFRCTNGLLIVGAKKHDHIKHVLRDFTRVQFKLCLLTYKPTRRCMDWHRRISPTSVDQSQPSVADRDSDPLLVATSLSPPLSRTLARDCAFTVAGPDSRGLQPTADAWETVNSFKSALKTHLHSID